jgi:hypothetical protein
MLRSPSVCRAILPIAGCGEAPLLVNAHASERNSKESYPGGRYVPRFIAYKALADRTHSEAIIGIVEGFDLFCPVWTSCV